MFPISVRTRWGLAVGAVIPALFGCATLSALIVRGLPTGAALADRQVLTTNLGVGMACIVVAIPVATAWGLRTTTMPAGGGPAVRRHLLLAIPLRLTVITGLVWSSASLALAVVNLESPWLAASLGIEVLLTGTVAATVTYWTSTRILRPHVAEALTRDPPTRPTPPGLRLRAVAAWVVGTGVPLLTLMLVAASALVIEFDTRRLALVALGLGASTAVTGLAAIVFVAGVVAGPINEVRVAMQRVQRGDLDTTVSVSDASETGVLQAGFNAMASGLRERESLRDLFGRHVGREVARRALEEASGAAGPVMGGEEREVAVLFVDLVGSTTLAVQLPPHAVVEVLNEFFAAVVDVVETAGGLINKFEGDAALVVFGAPLHDSAAAEHALTAARELYRRLSTGGPLRAGIGVAAGTAIAGNIGEPRRYEYTVIGDPVNEAARLCERAKDIGGVAASEATLRRAGDEEARRWRVTHTETLRGRDTPTGVAVPRAD
ncbi:HAMP domain-containing protein [Mycolicibacterium sp. 3033]|nr:HAMP domain-containing protein [Mycolicibacterium aurantiacum]